MSVAPPTTMMEFGTTAAPIHCLPRAMGRCLPQLPFSPSWL
jgi:hypothetical protein